MTARQPGLPRKLWMMWAQGPDDMPYLVRRCVESWVRYNPGWELTLLTRANMREWVDPALLDVPRDRLTPQQFANLTRLDALARHGGVWADATTLCMRPLDDWLPDVCASGFFAFDRPGPDRLLSNWFLASEPESYLVETLRDELGRYLLKRRLPRNRLSGHLVERLGRHLNTDPHRTAFWFTPPLRALGLVPYFAFHYTFAKLVSTDRRFADIWAATPKISADGPHTIQLHGYAAEPSPEIRDQVARRVIPLYKLDWRVDPSALPAASSLRLVLDSV